MTREPSGLTTLDSYPPAVSSPNGPPISFQTSTGRALNVFAFFTIQSNLIVGVTTCSWR